MTPTERIEAISERCRKARRKPDSDRANLALARAARAAKRMERLESEREHWTRAVTYYAGNVKAIAVCMGYDYQWAKRALIDLGLWDAVKEARLCR